jgi:cellulose synthase/poly-beta-1,6-N-acetylglucosamine synthase-like glycosyltransferase
MPKLCVGPRSPLLSIIIPAFNESTAIATCLEALLAQRDLATNPEIIVVDDGSTDDTAAIVGRYPVRLLTQPHAGSATARNRGAWAASGDVLLFTDADCRPQPDWAFRMSEPFADPNVCGVKGLFRTDQTGLVARLVQAEYEEKEANMLARRRVVFADTASAAFRADVFSALVGFRTDMKAVEDTEFSFRLAAQGHAIVVAPQAIVHHRHPETVGQYARRKFRYGAWGVMAYAAFPGRVADDSRTPWSMRLQLVLAPLLLLSVLVALIQPGTAPVPLALLVAFLLTVVPFAWRNRGDVAVAVIAGPMFFVRAVAIGAGLAVGLARFVVGYRVGAIGYQT